MAITVEPQIIGQVASDTTSYCYLYEPLRVSISEDTLALRIFIDLEVYNTANSSELLISIAKFATFDINPTRPLTVDLMKLARQYHRADVYNLSNINDLVGDKGWQSSVSSGIYNFKIYSDGTATPTVISKLPILGGRPFRQLASNITIDTAITNEFEQLDLDLSDRWLNFPIITTTLADPTANDAKPIIMNSTQTGGEELCGGFVIWKSKLGGWCYWGFNSRTEKLKPKYTGELGEEDFYSTEQVNGNPYIKPNYTGIETKYSVTLKALSLTSDELRAVSGINEATVVYLALDTAWNLELMRVTSATTPLNSMANGGDFSLSLDSIDTLEQKTR